MTGFSQSIVVEWTFPNNPDDSIADDGDPINLNKVLSVHGGVAPPTYIEEGITTYSASATNWANGAYTKYWQVEFSTTGYGDLTFESWQNSFSPGDFGPKYFDIQYRIGTSGTWTTFITWSIWTGNHWFQIAPTSIPSVCDNQPSIFIRWLMTSNIPTQGSGFVLNSAANRIDDIIITSYCPYPDTAGPITGTPLICTPETGVPYSIPPTPGASSYTWSYSGTGVTINGSSTSVTLDFSTTATSGVLSVFASNACGDGVAATYPITVHPMPEVSASPLTQTICPGSEIAPIVISTAKETPGTTISWDRDNTLVLTGIPSSGSDNPITGTLYSSHPQAPETTVFTILAESGGCIDTTFVSATVVDNQPPYFLTAPDSVYWCVQDIIEAWWDGMGDITPDRPDYHTFYPGDTDLDLNIATFSDSCSPSGSLILHWHIELVGGGTITGTGQLSTYPTPVQFPLGDNPITYWLEDPSGNVTPEAERPRVIVRVLARPEITRNF